MKYTVYEVLRPFRFKRYSFHQGDLIGGHIFSKPKRLKLQHSHFIRLCGVAETKKTFYQPGEVERARSAEEWAKLGYYTVRQLAEETGMSDKGVRWHARTWFRWAGRKPEEFFQPVVEGNRIVWQYVLPEEFRAYLKKKALGFRSGHYRNGAMTHKGIIITATVLAERYGIPAKKIRRDFRWWCEANGLDPLDFYKPGLGYDLPEEFIRWWERVALPQHRRVTYVSLAEVEE